jgi:hypothetical protein
MLKQGMVLLLVIVFSFTACLANAAMEATGNTAPVQPGNNVLAAAVFNDSPGSSDLTLIVQLKADNQILIDEGSRCKAIEPKRNIPSDANPTGWTVLGFDDSSWQDGTYGVGYADNDDNTVIGSKADNTVSIYSRAMFTMTDPSAIGKLTLGVDYDDAAVVWINGVEVARTPGTDIPDKPEWDSWSDQGSGQSHEASKQDPPRYETVDLQFEITTAVQPQGKLAVLWGGLKK